MLKDNIKAARQKQELSQEQLAESLHVVRQTVSKWEQGLSVPDADLLVKMSTVLDVSVESLLGENIMPASENQLEDITQKLAAIDAQLNHKRAATTKFLHLFFILTSVALVTIFVILYFLANPYQSWDYADPELAVMSVGFHTFEWVYVRVAPIILIGTITGVVLTRKKNTENQHVK